jgi:outer membrane beta-barrel protein
MATKNRLRFGPWGLLLLTVSLCVLGVDRAHAADTISSSTPKLIDGVQMEAVENYINPRSSEINLGIGVYPFDAYYYGLSINGGYTYHMSRNFAWEILNAQYFFSFQKTLTTELADRYKVDPTTITTLNYILTSDVQYVFAYGKFALLEDLIRYFRASVLLGGGIVKTSANNSVAGTTGLKFEVFTKESFSWTFEARDAVAFSGMNNYLTFILGTGLSF